MEATKTELLTLCTLTDRGQIANADQRRRATELIGALSACPKPSVDSPESLDSLLSGKWRLVYSSTHIFLNSPFFWAFKDTVGKEVSPYIFQFTDLLPGVRKGTAVQEVKLNMGEGSLVSMVEMDVLPGTGLANGMVVTESIVRLATTQDAGAPRFMVEITDTRVENSTLPVVSPVVNMLRFPSQQALQAHNAFWGAVGGLLEGKVEGGIPTGMKGKGMGDAVETPWDVVYVDGDMRITRAADGEVFVHVRA